MDAKIQEWIAQIQEIDQQVSQQFGDLSTDALNWKPSGEIWSIGENLDHLISINESYYPVLEEVKSGDYKAPWLIRKLPFVTKLMGTLIFNSVKPTSKKKIKTFDIWQPIGRKFTQENLQKFLEHHQKLIQTIKESKPLLEKGTLIYSPANSQIIYKLESAFDIIVTHEKRHLVQASGILEAYQSL